MKNEWYYIGESNKFFTRGDMYKLEINADKCNGELIFCVQSTSIDEFVVSKEYVGLEAFFQHWAPVDALRARDACQDLSFLF